MTDTLTLSTQTIQDIQNVSSTIGIKDWFNIVFLFINAAILCATIYVIRKSPSDAVKIGRQLNDAQLKDNAKINLFFTLFSYRGSPVHRDFVDALNRIDIVFYDTPQVLAAWHKLFDSLHQTNLVNKEDTWRLWCKRRTTDKTQHKPTEKQVTDKMPTLRKIKRAASRHTSQRFCSTFNFTQPHPKPTHHPTSGRLTL
jgi:hypothetical protein